MEEAAKSHFCRVDQQAETREALSLQLESEDHLEAESLSLGGGQSVFSQGLRLIG